MNLTGLKNRPGSSVNHTPSRKRRRSWFYM